MSKPTHVEVKEPRITIRRLADYMAASEQAKRSIAQSCKYRPIARVIQHHEAQLVIANSIRAGSPDKDKLLERAEFIRNKIADDDFEAAVNDHNAGYVERFAAVVAELQLPDADILPFTEFAPLDVNGVSLRLRPHLRLRRLTRTNKTKSGALMLRYAKGKALPPAVAAWQSAGIFGFLRAIQEDEAAEADKALCITLDAYQAATYEAPGNAVYLFNEMKAACAAIAERWPAIKPPKNAVLN